MEQTETNSNDVTSLEEVLNTQSEIRKNFLGTLLKFSIRVLVLNTLLTIGISAISYLLRPERPIKFYYFIGTSFLIFLSIAFISIFIFSLLKPYRYYQRNLKSVESRIRAGETVYKNQNPSNTQFIQSELIPTPVEDEFTYEDLKNAQQG